MYGRSVKKILWTEGCTCEVKKSNEAIGRSEKQKGWSTTKKREVKLVLGEVWNVIEEVKKKIEIRTKELVTVFFTLLSKIILTTKKRKWKEKK